MAGRPPGELLDKHWQALKMLEAGDMSKKDIAAKINVSPEYFSALINGDISKAGLIADLFKKEYSKIASKREDNIKAAVKENQEVCQAQMRRVLKELQGKKRLNHEEKKLLGLYNNSLNKSTPNVNIKNLSYSYTTGMTPEELIHEFGRLKAIAEGSFERRAVQGAQQGGSGTIPPADERGSELAEDSQDSSVRAAG